jgi:hypothetical protein
VRGEHCRRPRAVTLTSKLGGTSERGVLRFCRGSVSLFHRVTDACLGPKRVRRLAALGVPVCAATTPTTPTTGTTSLGDPLGDVSGRNLFNVCL